MPRKTRKFIFLYNYTDYGAGLYSSGSILFSRCGVFDGYHLRHFFPKRKHCTIVSFVQCVYGGGDAPLYKSAFFQAFKMRRTLRSLGSPSDQEYLIYFSQVHGRVSPPIIFNYGIIIAHYGGRCQDAIDDSSHFPHPLTIRERAIKKQIENCNFRTNRDASPYRIYY